MPQLANKQFNYSKFRNEIRRSPHISRTAPARPPEPRPVAERSDSNILIDLGPEETSNIVNEERGQFLFNGGQRNSPLSILDEPIDVSESTYYNVNPDQFALENATPLQTNNYHHTQHVEQRPLSPDPFDTSRIYNNTQPSPPTLLEPAHQRYYSEVTSLSSNYASNPLQMSSTTSSPKMYCAPSNGAPSSSGTSYFDSSSSPQSSSENVSYNPIIPNYNNTSGSDLAHLPNLLISTNNTLSNHVSQYASSASFSNTGPQSPLHRTLDPSFLSELEKAIEQNPSNSNNNVQNVSSPNLLNTFPQSSHSIPILRPPPQSIKSKRPPSSNLIVNTWNMKNVNLRKNVINNSQTRSCRTQSAILSTDHGCSAGGQDLSSDLSALNLNVDRTMLNKYDNKFDDYGMVPASNDLSCDTSSNKRQQYNVYDPVCNTAQDSSSWYASTDLTHPQSAPVYYSTSDKFSNHVQSDSDNGFQDKIQWLKTEVGSSFSEEDCLKALYSANWDVASASRNLKLNNLCGLNIASRQECEEALDRNNWNVELAAANILETKY